MINMPHEYTRLGDIYENGNSYIYSLLSDYSRYVVDFQECIDVNDFIKGWNCICRENFSNLEPGDNVYDARGVMYKVTDTPYDSSDSDDMYIEVMYNDEKNNNYQTEELSLGELYSSPFKHTKYAISKIIGKDKKGSNNICQPKTFLITKKNQQ